LVTQGVGALANYLSHGRALLTSNAAEAGGFIKNRPELDRPDLRLHFCIRIVDDHNRKIHFTIGMSCMCAGLDRRAAATFVLLARISRWRRSSIQTSSPVPTISRRSPRRRDRPDHSRPASARPSPRPLYLRVRPRRADRLRELIRERADTIYHPVETRHMGVDDRSVIDP
jgi:choline dehydrogenase-like flavoprotein